MPWLMRVARYLLKDVDKDVKEKGVSKTLNECIQKCNSNLEIEIEKESEETLKKQSVLIVANHPAEADPLVLVSSLPKRKDINVIINSSFVGFGDNFDKHLIPVYINHHLVNNKRNWKFKFFKKAFGIKVYSEETEHQKNIESVKKASQKIDNGEMVIIFPMGGSVDNRWYSGIGHLIKNVKSKNRSFVVMAYIEGTSNRDYLRLIPLLGKLFSGFKVSFSEPLRLDNFDNEDAKTITLDLENNYKAWTNALVKIEDRSRLNFISQVYLKGYLLLRTVFFWLVTK